MYFKKLQILDLDGTVIDSIRQAHQAVGVVFKSVELEPPSLVEYVSEFNYPWINGFRNRGVQMPEEEIAQLFKHEMSRFDSFQMFADVVDYFTDCKRQNRVLALVSANSEEHVYKCLISNGILPQFDFISGDKVKKSHAFIQACEFTGIPLEDAVVIGDTPGDMIDAREAGISAAAILRYPETQACRKFRSKMLSSGARDIVDSLEGVIIKRHH